MSFHHRESIALVIICLLINLINLNLLLNLFEITERAEGVVRRPALCSIGADALVVSAAADEATIDRPFAFPFGIAFALTLTFYRVRL